MNRKKAPQIQCSVWSFWTKPFIAHHHSSWCSEKHHLLSWILSVETARKHYPKTKLVTDDRGAKMLVDGLGLEFDSVSIELNELQPYDPDWWVLGKLWAYRCQTEPFVHIDNDVFLWKALPTSVATAPVLAQNPEYFVFGEHYATCWWYRPEIFDERVKETNGWLPEEWNWAVTHQSELAYCTGIMGGTQTEFISHYANLALQIATDPRNQAAFCLMENKIRDSLLIEQYFLASCLEYHKQYKNSKFQNINIKCLFESSDEAFSSEQAEKLGYTHLIGAAKQDQEIAQKVEKRVAQDYPAHYERCLRYLKTVQVLPSTTSAIHATSSKELIQVSVVHDKEEIPAFIVAPQAWIALLNGLSNALRDRLAKQALFINSTCPELDRTLIYFALQDIFQICTTGVIQARMNRLSDLEMTQIILTLVEGQQSFLNTLERHGSSPDEEKDSFIEKYRHYLSELNNEVIASDSNKAYFLQKKIIDWLTL